MLKKIKILTQATSLDYDAELKVLNNNEDILVKLRIHDNFNFIPEEPPKEYVVYAYGRENRGVDLMENRLSLSGRSYAELEKKGRIYIDKQNENSKLEELLEDIPRNAILIIGTITDFMNPDIYEMRDILSKLNEKQITIVSMAEHDYDYDKYYYKIGLADNIARVRMGLKPELK